MTLYTQLWTQKNRDISDEFCIQNESRIYTHDTEITFVSILYLYNNGSEFVKNSNKG